MKVGIAVFGIIVYIALITFVIFNYITLTKYNKCREIDFKSNSCERMREY